MRKDANYNVDQKITMTYQTKDQKIEQIIQEF